MNLEYDLQQMGAHLVDRLNEARLTILVGNEPAFKAVGYGEPRSITKWPYLSVQPQDKVRELGGTRQFKITFIIWLILYHGQVASTLSLQQGAHKRIEAVERFFMTDFKWNFVDATDNDKDKVIFGYPSGIDHPVVIAPKEELWSASRLALRAESKEYF